MQIGVGIIGTGTVGSGVIEILHSQKDSFFAKFGFELNIVALASKDPEQQIHPVLNCPWYGNPDELIENPNVQILVELAGGYELPKKWINAALLNGKHIVTANKALIAKYGDELLPLATSKNLHFQFEAAVGGGIPIIKAIQESLQANEIQAFSCIINGTCNYILTEMTQNGVDFDAILKQAQEMGYAEADPSFDIDGIDALHKTSILASLASRQFVDFEILAVKGLRGLSQKDISFAKEMDCTIKLLGRFQRTETGLAVRVQPFMIPNSHLLSHVNGVLNAVYLETDRLGPALFTGAGAGKLPTASAVVSDILHIAQSIQNSSTNATNWSWFNRQNPALLAHQGEFIAKFYLHLQVKDQTGVLASITSIFASKGVSIESFLQRPEVDQSADLFLVTHETKESAMDSICEELSTLGILSSPVKTIAIL